MSTESGLKHEESLPSITEEESMSSKCKASFNWIRLFMSALLPLIFGIFTIIFSLQQDKIAHINREHDEALASESRMQTVYDSYVDEVSRLLLSRNFNRSDSSYLKAIRVKTLGSLRQLDAERKREIIIFLYENELIRNDKYSVDELIALDNGDVTEVDFVHSTTFKCRLNNLYLSNILGSGMTFYNCHLRDVDFSGASMIRTTFNSSILSFAKFINADLSESIFEGNNMQKVNFSSATLTRMKFGNSVLKKVDFTNADLIGSDLNVDTLTNLSSENLNVFINTRLPNGTFSIIDSSQLIRDGSAELMCTEIEILWKTVDGFTNVTAVNQISNNNNIINPIDGNCLFMCNWNTRAEQTVTIRHFSLLIDSEQALFNISAHFGCISSNENDRAFIEISYASDEDVNIKVVRLESTKIDSQFDFKYQIGVIPVGTREISINIGANIARISSINVTEPFCFIDDIKYFIQRMANSNRIK